MKEKKVDFKFPERETVEVVFGGQKVQVKLYLDITDRQAILDAYFAERDLSPVDSQIEAEFNLILNVINLMTDIRVEISSNKKAIKFVNNLLNTGTWYRVKDCITNFSELQRDIERISQQKNLEGKLNKMIDKVGLFIDNISKLDWSVDGVQKIATVLAPELKQLATFFPNGIDKPIEPIQPIQ